MTTAYLGLGSNIGDRLAYLQSAVDKLAHTGEIKSVSKVYETEPWGKTDQARFLNACIVLETEIPPEELLEKLVQTEQTIGRVKSERWGPREIDIDILFYGHELIKSQRLTVPHPLLHERAFVLMPLNDIAPDFSHPVLEQTVKELLKQVDTSGVTECESSINLN